MKRTFSLYVAWLIAAVMLVFAVTGRHPYSFYSLLRWLCCAAFAYSAFVASEKNRVAWAWIFGVLAVLFNPIIPVHFQRDTWQMIDWGTIGVIVVAAVCFLPRVQESDVIVSDNQAKLDISKQRIAREWLVFLSTLPLGFGTCFFFKYFLSFWGAPAPLSSAFDDFYYDHFGLGHASSLAFWFAPYLGLLLIRSVLWSISTLQAGVNFKREASYSLVAVYLIGAFWFVALIVQNQADKRRAAETKQDWFTRNAPKGDTSLVLAGDLARILLSDVYQGPVGDPQSARLRVAGTIRNDLSRPVEKVQLKVSIYDAAARLIETQTLPSVQNSRLEPGVPAAFDVIVRLNNLPTGYQCRVGIIEAHYVQQ